MKKEKPTGSGVEGKTWSIRCTKGGRRVEGVAFGDRDDDDDDDDDDNDEAEVEEAEGTHRRRATSC